VFAEGVDYPGDMLKAVAVVGPCLPAVSLERELLKRYYEEQFERGFEYAFVVPGMTRVVQAAATSSGFDVSSLINACIKDNIITFSSNGSGTTDEGPTKCNAGDPQTQNFTWNFTTNETVLNVNAAIFAGQSGNFTILALTETSLALEGTISTSSGNVTGQIYFIH
jgi:hypothetical protein